MRMSAYGLGYSDAEYLRSNVRIVYKGVEAYGGRCVS